MYNAMHVAAPLTWGLGWALHRVQTWGSRSSAPALERHHCRWLRQEQQQWSPRSQQQRRVILARSVHKPRKGKHISCNPSEAAYTICTTPGAQWQWLVLAVHVQSHCNSQCFDSSLSYCTYPVHPSPLSLTWGTSELGRSMLQSRWGSQLHRTRHTWEGNGILPHTEMYFRVCWFTKSWNYTT